jgi:hypothetical protein
MHTSGSVALHFVRGSYGLNPPVGVSERTKMKLVCVQNICL